MLETSELLATRKAHIAPEGVEELLRVDRASNLGFWSASDSSQALFTSDERRSDVQELASVGETLLDLSGSADGNGSRAGDGSDAERGLESCQYVPTRAAISASKFKLTPWQQLGSLR